VSELRHIKIVESGEELVDFLALCPALLLDRPRFKYRRETVLRKTVAEKLCQASCRLPKEYRLAVIEGWRPPHIQRRMYRMIWNWYEKEHPDWSPARLTRFVNRFSAPMNQRVPPPHTTGAAVDVMLAQADGTLLDHCTPYDQFDSRGFAFDAPGLTDRARRTRQILAEAFATTGISNYPSEYWHWSYGDQGWAYRGGHKAALYGAIEPPGWSPAPEDDVEGPLEMVEDG
jgi:zinc D-Ala-D-Ala dipeptidase